jgi:hypothetical protein
MNTPLPFETLAVNSDLVLQPVQLVQPLQLVQPEQPVHLAVHFPYEKQ